MLASMGGDIDESKVFAGIGKACGALPEIYSLFVSHSEFFRVQSDGTAGWVSLKPFADETFRRKPALLLAWISQSLLLEFRDFFSESGRNLIGETANGWTSLMGSTGESGV
jgi:hypothetical protein